MDSNQVVAPMLMQRTCDGGKSDMTEEQWASLIALKLQGQPTGFMGVEPRFNGTGDRDAFVLPVEGHLRLQ